MAKRRSKRHARQNPRHNGEEMLGDVVEMLGIEALVRLENAPPDTPPRRAALGRAVSRRSAVVVGDQVRCVKLEEDGSDTEREGPPWMITAVSKRRNVLVRPNMHGHAQAVAANLDRVVAVVTPKAPPLRLGLIDRYMAAAWQADIQPMICLNKIDLDGPDTGARAALEPYEALGVEVVVTSARGASPEQGIEAFRESLRGLRSVFVGHSGVGKSSLACALIPGLERRIGEVNEVIGRGRHTTTTSSLLSLPGGGELVDTPGVRAFGLFGIEAKALWTLYPEFVERAEGCRFRGCSHIHEPGCAVRAALKEGEVDAGRYERYIQIFTTLAEG